MNKSLALLLTLGLALTSGAAQRQSLKHKHVPPAVASLTPIGDLEATNILHLSISLPLRNQPQLDSLLQDLYDPGSPNYRHWLTSTQFAEQFGPTEKDYESLSTWAQSKGLSISMRHSNRAVLSVDADVPSVEQAFKVRMKKYHHPKDIRDFHAPDQEPTVDLSVPIFDISGLDNYGKTVSTVSHATQTNTVPTTGSGPGGGYIGYDFRRAYVPGTTLDGTGQNIATVQFADWYDTDISAYRVAAGLPVTTIHYVPINGGPTYYDIEVALDMDMIYSMAPGAQMWMYEGPTATAPWVDLLNKIATDNTCKQISCSWADFSGNYSGYNASYYTFMQMAAQGQSFFTSSGDYGAYVNNDGTWIPYPAVFTNITVVGGTTLTMNGSGVSYASETAWNQGLWAATGGGINVFYNTPTYQIGMDWTSNLGSSTLRNLPDVAMAAQGLYVIFNGAGSITGGTSGSTPLWAGFCALINQQAAAKGKPSVGWLNPSLYAIGKSAVYTDCFHDITTGNNFWSGSPTHYPAVAGYDLCTGWGTPNGTNLINALYTGPTIVSLVMSNGLFIKAQ